MKINTSYTMEFEDDGSLVYFKVNVKELFDINLLYPGIVTALNKAFRYSKKFIPVKTGLMKSSYTMDRINNEAVMVYFDPQKILGKKRLGRIVKVYYPQYLKEYSSRFNWLDIIMRNFFNELISNVKQLDKKQKEKSKINLIAALAFLKILEDNYKKKKEEAAAKKETSRRSVK